MADIGGSVVSSRFLELLGTDFDGQPASDVEDVIYEALDDPRHHDRVPGLTALLADSAASPRERFLACVALTTWAEPTGYTAVTEAAGNPSRALWYNLLIDRKFSVDNTFAQLCLAVGDSDALCQTKGTCEQRVEAFRSLVKIADTEYFDEKLGDHLDDQTVARVLPDVRDTVERGVAALSEHRRPQFDLATQLVDLAAAVAAVDTSTSVGLVMEVLSQEASPRALVHAVSIVQRSQADEARRFAEYLRMVGDDRVRSFVDQALAKR
ncbi:hypothetical protein AB0G64_02905 [Streptomyces longwoodensis]|uniref:hypothetical protein n=1 Tax=Streptomyces longwoodensis TaxID=68231 RepID=UPI0033E0CDD4